MTGRDLYEQWQALRLTTADAETPWHELGYRDRDAWDELAAWVGRRSAEANS